MLPSKGQVFLDGRELNFNSDKVEDRQIGYVFQEGALFPHLTVRSNLEYGLRGLASDVVEKRVKTWSTSFQIGDLLGRYPHEISGGQQQRVAVARALVRHPRLLLMDEPFSGLDESIKSDLLPEMRKVLKEQGMSVLMVTHDQNEAFSMADEIGVMNEGRVLQVGAARQLYDDPQSAFVAKFLGGGELLESSDLLVKALSLSDVNARQLFYRPEWLTPSLDGDGFNAQVTQKKFLGAFVELSLDVEGIDLKAKVSAKTADEFEAEHQGNWKFLHRPILFP